MTVRRAGWIAAGAAVTAALLFAFRAPLERGALAAVLDVALGARTQIGSMEIGASRAVLHDVHVQRAGGPLFDARTVDVGYSARDLLPGGSRRFGLTSIVVDHPVVTIRREPDGTFNFGRVPQTAAPAGPSAAPAAAGTPLRLTARVQDGTVLLVDPYRYHAASRRQRVDGIEATATIDTAHRSRYGVRATYRPSERGFPLTVDGLVDADRLFALHRLRAAAVPLAPLVNYFLDSDAATLLDGDARDVDVSLYALGDDPSLHAAGTAQIAGAALALSILRRPLTGVTGAVNVFDDGIAAPQVDAAIAGLPVRVAGGLYDFADPRLRVGVQAGGPLGTLRTLAAISADLPVRGDARFAAVIEGRAADPVVVGRFSAPAPSFRGIQARDVLGTAGYYRNSVSVVPFTARYGAVALRSYGAIDLGKDTISTIDVSAAGPASAIPYAAQIVPSATVRADGVLSGTNGAFAARGVVVASGPDRLSSLVGIDERGRGVLGPLQIEQAGGGTAAGAFYLARDRNASAFWFDARDLAIAAAPNAPSGAELGLPALPPFGGGLTATVGGEGPPSGFAIAGNVRVRDLAAGPVNVATATADVLGSPSDLRIGKIAAGGPWGTFAGSGAYGPGGLVLRGTYAGSLQRLATFTGPIGGRGPVRAPVSIAVSPDRTVVQTTGADTRGASVRGVPIDGAAGTLTIAGSDVRVVAAQAAVAGGTLTATGSFDKGLRVSAASIDAARLRGSGMPLDAGRAALVGVAAAGRGGLGFDGGAVVWGGRYKGLEVQGNGDVRLGGNDVTLGRLDAGAYDAWALVGGHIAGVDGNAPRYALTARLRQADIGDIAEAARIESAARYHVDGTAEADLTVTGAGAQPQVAGRVVVPEFTVNGLFVQNGSAHVRASPAMVALDGGTLQVGSTNAHFGGAFRPRRSVAFAFDSHAADLSDFDDFFDEGDMLSGKGHVSLAIGRARGTLTTFGDVAMADLRVSHAYFGDALSDWSSDGRQIKGHAGFAGRTGAVDATGSIAVPRRGKLARVFARSSFDLKMSASKFDVSAWTEALGYDLPVAGLVDAQGTVRGRFPAIALSGHASLENGTYGAVPIDKLTVSATSTLDRTTIDAADLQVGSISAHGSGSFGYKPTDPLTLGVHATSPDLGSVIGEITGNPVPIHGSFEADVRASGTVRKPVVEGGFDVEKGSVAGVQVPRALGEVALSGRNIELRDAEVAFATGTLYLAGSLPLQLSPFGIGPSAAAISLEASAKGVDIANFAPLFPKGSDVKGRVDGRVAVEGTVGAPALAGQVALAGGEFAEPGVLNAPLTDISGRIVFDGTTAAIEALHAGAGGGSIDGTGSLTVGDLVRPGPDTTLSARVRFDKARIDVAAYGKGQVDGTLTLDHQPRSLAVLGGSVSLQDAVIPFSALYNPAAAGASAGDPTTVGAEAVSAPPFGLPNAALDLTVTVGRNVRVRSSVIDVGASGSVQAAGTLAAPTLAGTFTASGGTLTYFNRVFRVAEGTVTFDPALGLVPLLDATATSHVSNPDPNALRNLTGSADITITVHGPVTNLTIGLQSDPPYDRQQILGLLLNVPAIGGTSLFETPGTVPTVTNGNGSISVAQEAFGVLNAQFTRNLLAPLETGLGQQLGLSNINLTLGYTGAVGLSARKVLGKNIYAVYATTFGYPYRQTFGFELRPSPNTAAQLTIYQQYGAVDLLNVSQPLPAASINRITVAEPNTGTSGFSFTLQRLFW